MAQSSNRKKVNSRFSSSHFDTKNLSDKYSDETIDLDEEAEIMYFSAKKLQRKTFEE